MVTPSSATKNTLIHNFQELFKELDCHNAISDIAANPNATFDQIVKNIADRLPLVFQAPELTCACVTILNKAIKTANFKPCRWKLETDLALDEKIAGKLEVGYLGATPNGSSPFLEEHKKLLQASPAASG